MATSPKLVGPADPALAKSFENQTPSVARTSPPTVSANGTATSTGGTVTRGIAPKTSGDTTTYNQATQASSGTELFIVSSNNNDSNDIVTVYNTEKQISVSAVNQTINNYKVTNNNSYGNSNVADFLTSYDGDLSAGNLNVIGATNLGDVSNVHIEGGTNGQVLSTNGSGALVWSNVSSGPGLGNIGFDNNVIYSNGGVVVNNSDLGNGQTAGMSIPIQGDGNAVSLYNTYGDITLLAGNIGNSQNVQTWNFSASGNLTLPSNTFAVNYANGDPVQLGENVPIANNSTPGIMALGNGFVLNSNNQVSTSNLYSTNLTQPTQHYTLNLDTNGVLHLPDQSIINGSTLRGVPGTGELNYTGITIGPNSGNPENTWMWVDASNAYIGTNYSANSHTWTFDADGNLTLPANTFAVNYANGTQVPLGTPAGSSGAAQFNWQGNFSNQGGTPGDTYSTLQFDSNGMPTLNGTNAYQQRVDYSPYMQILAPRVESTDFGIVAGPAIQITGYADNVFYNTPRSAYLSVQDQSNATQQWDFGILGNGDNNFVVSDRTNSNQWAFGTDGNLTLPYSSTTGNISVTMNNIGNVAYNSASPLSSGGSLEFAGDELNHFLVVPNEARFAPGTGDFTIEWYQYVTSDGHGYPRPFSLGICCGNINSLLVGLFEGGSNNIAIQTQSGYNPFSGWNNTLNVWQHIAVVRSSGTVTIYQDGVAFNSVSIPDDIAYDPANGYFLSIGSPTVDGTTGTESINSQYVGLITNMRYVVGTAVYTGNFTPSTDPLTLIPGTELLLQVANSGTLAEALYIGTIANNSSIISNGNAWTFGGDGNLTLPSNTSSINYANGSPYGGGGNANTGNITFNDINIIGTGNLNLQPDPANAGSYLDIFISSGPDIHLVASASANLILGKDEQSNVMTSWDGNVYIQSWDVNTNTQGGVWTFGGDGNLTLPNDATISDSSNVASLNAGGNTRFAQLYWNGNIGNGNPYDGSDYYTWAYTSNVGFTIRHFNNNTSTDNEWKFGIDGNLTLPTGTPSINYANGSPYGGGGGANTGNVTFDDQVVVGTGSNDGSGGLYLAPGLDSTANLQYLRVRGGDVASHIHLDTGNNRYYDQYFGDDSKFVKLEADGNVKIGTSDFISNSAQWTFGVDGNLTLPANSTIKNNAEVSYDGGVTIQVSDLANAVVASPGSIVGNTYNNTGFTKIIFTDSTLYNALVTAGIAPETIVATTWSNGSTTQLNTYVYVQFPGSPNTFSLRPCDSNGNTVVGDWVFPSVVGTTIPANVAITSVSPSTFHIWNFVSDGNLTVPKAIVGAGYSRLDMVTDGPNTAYLGTTNNDTTALYLQKDTIQLYANTDVYISANTGGTTQGWTFGADGNLTLPVTVLDVGLTEQTTIRSQRKIIPPYHWSAIINSAFPDPTVVYTATSSAITSMKVTVQVQHSGFRIEMFDVSATYTGSDTYYSVSNRLKPPTITDTTVLVNLNGSGVMQITLTINSGSKPAYITYDATEFGIPQD